MPRRLRTTLLVQSLGIPVAFLNDAAKVRQEGSGGLASGPAAVLATRNWKSVYEFSLRLIGGGQPSAIKLKRLRRAPR